MHYDRPAFQGLAQTMPMAAKSEIWFLSGSASLFHLYGLVNDRIYQSKLLSATATLLLARRLIWTVPSAAPSIVVGEVWIFVIFDTKKNIYFSQ